MKYNVQWQPFESSYRKVEIWEVENFSKAECTNSKESFPTSQKLQRYTQEDTQANASDTIRSLFQR